MSKIAVIKLKTHLKRELQVIHTLELLKQIAASEFHYLEKRKKEASQLVLLLESFFSFYHSKHLTAGIFSEEPSRIPAMVAVTSDEGFLGALNNLIVEKAVGFARDHPGTHLVVLGRRGARKIRDFGIEPVEFPGIPFPLDYDAVLPLKKHLLDLYTNNRVGSIHMIYARCHSFTRQTLEIASLLPYNILGRRPPVEDEEELNAVLIEPDIGQIIRYTIALCFGRQLYEIFWESKLSEVAARTIEINERYEQLSKSSEKIRMRYFRASHEVIDAGIREVFSSRHFSRKLRKAKTTEEAGHVG